MKKFILVLLCIYAWTMTNGQSVELGLRDNQYIHGCYISRNSWLIGYEQSLLNVKAKEQSGRIFAGYIFEKGAWNVSGMAYGGTEYAGNWQTGGVMLKGGVVRKRVEIGITLDANYDTYFDFRMNYDINTQYAIWQTKSVDELSKQQLDICVSFGNLPEYRDNVKNVRVGVKFTSGSLWVQPEVSIPNIEKSSSKYLRMLCNIGWNLKIK